MRWRRRETATAVGGERHPGRVPLDAIPEFAGDLAMPLIECFAVIGVRTLADGVPQPALDLGCSKSVAVGAPAEWVAALGLSTGASARLPRHEPTMGVPTSLREVQLSPMLFQQTPRFQALDGKPIHLSLEKLGFGDVVSR